MAFLEQGKEQSYVHSTPHRCVAVHRHVPCHFSLALPISHFCVAEANSRGEGPNVQEAGSGFQYRTCSLKAFKYKNKIFEVLQESFSASFGFFLGLEFMSRLLFLTCSQLCLNCCYYIVWNSQERKKICSEMCCKCKVDFITDLRGSKTVSEDFMEIKEYVQDYNAHDFIFHGLCVNFGLV